MGHVCGHQTPSQTMSINSHMNVAGILLLGNSKTKFHATRLSMRSLEYICGSFEEDLC